MKLEFTEASQKQFQKLPQNQVKKIAKKIKNLQQNPLLGKKLQSQLKNYYSLRAWPYRIIYQLNPSEKRIIITDISHRQSTYK